MPAPHRSASVVAVVALSLLLGACGSDGSRGEASYSGTPDTTVLHAGDIAVLMETEPFTGAVAGMGVDGRLAVVDGCVGIAGWGRVAVFPPSTSVTGTTADDLVLTIDGVTLRLGDHFTAGTRGSADGYPLSTYGDLDDQAPDSCRDTQAVQLDEFQS